MSDKLRIVMVDDNADDLELMEHELRKSQLSFSCEKVHDEEGFALALAVAPDLVLADCKLPAFSGLEALLMLRKRHPEVPFISLSGSISEETAAELIKHGATDFISKENLGRLAPAVHRALREVEQREQILRAESSLRESESRFRTVFEKAGTGIALENIQGRIIETNAALQQMLGYDSEELQQITRRMFTHGYDHQEEQAQYERLTSGALDYLQSERRFVRKDGRIIWGRLTISLTRDATGQPQFRLVMIEDITERHRAAEAHQQFAAIVESSNDAIFSNTFDGVIFSWNPAAERVYGYAAREANGHAVSLIIPPEKESEFARILERIRRGERIDNFETTHRRKDGSLIEVSVTASPIKESSGKIIGASSISRDITERKRSERALRDSEENYRKLVELSPDAILICCEGVFVYLNSAGLKLFGAADPGQIVGKPVVDFLHADDQTDTTAMVARPGAWPQAEAPLMERRLLRVDGTMVEVESAAIELVYRGKPALQVVARDITERKKAEAALRASEASLIRAQRIARLGNWEYDLLADKLVWSEVAYQVFGVTPGTFAGTCAAFLELVHPEDRELLLRARQEALDGGRHYNVDHRIVLPNGEIRTVNEQAELVRDEEGRPRRLLGTVLDITERKRAENRSAAFANLGKLLSSATSAGEAAAIIAETADKLFGWDACNLILCSADLKTFSTVYTVDLVDGQRQIIPPALMDAKPSPRMLEIFEKGAQIVLRQEAAFTGGNLYTFGDKTRPSASIMYVPVRNGSTIVGIFSIHSYAFNAYTQDGLEVLQALGDHCGGALERIRAAAENQKLAAFPQYNPNPVLELRADGSISYFNEAARQMAQSLGKHHPSELLPVETPGFVRECLATGETRLRHETVIRDRTISWSFFPVRAISIVHCYAADITDRQNLEAQLRQSQKMESVGQLAGGIAHDFNNILTVIQGHTSLLGMTPELPPAALESTQQIGQAAERAANLTRQLLTFSRRQVILPKNLDLNEVVNNMTRMLRRILGENIIFQVHYAPNLPLIHADPGMMDQILLNLAVNSRDAMPKGGRLFVNTSAVRIDEPLARQIPGAVPGEYVCLMVKDTGCGIAAEHMPHIFEPFFTTKDVGKGTGLGLATVYGIVQQHRGWIKVSSQLAEETVFQIYLPALAEKAMEVKSPKPEPPVPGGSETILLVEDEAPLRLLVRNVLERQGYRVLEADSGVDALPLWLEHRDQIDLLLTDMVMPYGVSGRELAERLLGDKPNLKVIYSSGYSLAVVGSDMVLEDGLNFLQKPYHPRKLSQAVRDCLDS